MLKIFLTPGRFWTNYEVPTCSIKPGWKVFTAMQRLLVGFFLPLLFNYMCVCVGIYMWVWIFWLPEARRGHYITWSWSFRRLWAIQSGSWGPKLGSLQEHYTLLTAVISQASGWISRLIITSVLLDNFRSSHFPVWKIRRWKKMIKALSDSEFLGTFNIYNILINL